MELEYLPAFEWRSIYSAIQEFFMKKKEKRTAFISKSCRSLNAFGYIMDQRSGPMKHEARSLIHNV